MAASPSKSFPRMRTLISVPGPVLSCLLRLGCAGAMGHFLAELKWRHIYWIAAAHMVVAWLLLQPVNNAVLAAESPRRVFLLQGESSTEATAQGTAEAFRQRLKKRLSEDIEINSDFLHLGRFRGPENENLLVQLLRAKFAEAKPEIIVPISREAIDFMIRHRPELALGIPIVYCCTPALPTDALGIPPDIPGVVNASDWAGTLALAQRLQPNAKTLVIIAGASDIDLRRDQEVLNALQPLLQKYDIKRLTGLPYNELLKQVSALPRDSIVLLRRVFEDGDRRFRGLEIGEDLSNASNAPIYSASAAYFGSGILGGSMDSRAGQGAAVADLALDVLLGKNPLTLPHQTGLPAQYRVDARQLERFGFTEAALPPGTSVEYRQPTLWEQYRNTIALVLLAFSVLLGFIALLLLEMRKRRKAEEARKIAEVETEFKRKEVTHLMRVAALGELSGGIAHELGQPLAAILANAEAAQVLLARTNHDKKEIAEILEDIVQQDRRAGEIIQHLRRLLRKGERQSALINLNELITSTLGLLRSELVKRNIKIATRLKPNLPSISGDAVELQQVLLNLMINAMEAIASTPAPKCVLDIGTETTEDGNVELAITDSGPGISSDELERLFQPFFTTKKHGLGLGLSICSTIVRSHRGRLTLSNASGGGATAIVSLRIAVQMAAS
jgi:signal transduction histidine kinase